MSENKITLYELNQNVKKALKNNMPGRYWVISEINEFKVNASGHCYMELIEKEEASEDILAKAKATIWAYTYKMLKPYFETDTGFELSAGLKVLLNVSIEFHEYYGYSLNVHDIDPSYTLGDLARKKLEVIAKLEEDGVYEMNKNLTIPLVPQRIAIISSKTAAGYKDFIHQLDHNDYGYKFYHKLFPAYMQGNSAEESIISALDKIYLTEDFFDIVVIIRGGGSQSDLYCFNNYWLSFNIAQFSLPVITGIGHEKDETVVDLVAHTKLKTPTAVAEFLTSKLLFFERDLDSFQNRLLDKSLQIIKVKNLQIDNISKQLTSLIHNSLYEKRLQIINLTNNFKNLVTQFLLTHNQKLYFFLLNIKRSAFQYLLSKTQQHKLLSKIFRSIVLKYFTNYHNKLKTLGISMNYLNPQNILKRGYSVSYVDSKILKNTNQLKKGDNIQTKLYKGGFSSKLVDLEE